MGNRIKMLREKNKMTQSELASALGIRQNTLSTWETGRYEPDNEMLKAIASYFGVSVDYVIGGDPPWTSMPGDQIDMMRMVRLIRLVEQLSVEQFDLTVKYCEQLLTGSMPDQTQPEVSDADAALLRAYHAASLRDRSLVDQILQAYAAEDSSKSAG